ncbi:DARS2 family protein [Megaselia abdita]
MFNSGNYGTGGNAGGGGGGGGYWNGVGPNNTNKPFGPPGGGSYNNNAGRHHFEDYQGGYNPRNNDYGRNNYQSGGGGGFNNSFNNRGRNDGFQGGRNDGYQGGRNDGFSKGRNDNFPGRPNDGYPGPGGTGEVLNAVIDLLGGYAGREEFPHVYCGKLSNCNIGDLVELSGQLFRRNSRFAEIRDKSGIVQLIVDDDRNPELATTFKNIPDKSNITVQGKICLRPRNARNVSINNGDIEIEIMNFPKHDGDRNNKSYRNQPKLPTTQIAIKRPYSTMSETNSLGVTLSEYKHATTNNLLQYFVNRDWTTAELSELDAGKQIKIVGWLNEFNSVSKQFQKLKDGYGVIQVVSSRDEHQQIFEIAADSGLVVEVAGKVTKRPTNSINSKIATGTIEIQVASVRALGPDDPYDGPEKFKKTKLDTEEIITNQTAATNKFTYRTHNCSEIRIENVGEQVTLCGWVQYFRMNKFIVLRDGYGVTQILIPSDNEDIHSQIEDLTYETVIRVEGTVVPRPETMKNFEQETGEIEIKAQSIEILNPARSDLPFDIREHNKADEALRLQHRYIDLRSADMQYNLRTRSAVIMKMRECLINKFGFVEVETPTLFRKTPGGAQEFIVPTRKPGKFYSLVQSPQQFKQMLMSGGIDRYFQVARCYRDEKGRQDRQPEFTQLDIELSFATAQDVMSLMEEVVTFCWPKYQFNNYAGLEFGKITYDDAMTKYGSDKPDTRFGWELTDCSDIHPNAVALIIRGREGNISVKTQQRLSALNKSGDQDKAKIFLSNYTSNPEKFAEKLDKFTKNEGDGKKFLDMADLGSGDGVIFGYGSDKIKVQELMGRIRIAYRNILENLGICKPRSEQQSKFLWVVDFPMFFKNEEGGFDSAHHPFTAPHPDDLEKLKNKEDLESIRSQAYDLILDGNEVAGGSIRIHDGELQRKVLDDILKIPHSHMQHLLDALESGCPPHGGIALGVDRFISVICKSSSIRDVIAFPKSAEGRDMMSKAPVPVSKEDLKFYNIDVLDSTKKDDNSEESTKKGENSETEVKMDEDK